MLEVRKMLNGSAILNDEPSEKVNKKADMIREIMLPIVEALSYSEWRFIIQNFHGFWSIGKNRIATQDYNCITSSQDQRRKKIEVADSFFDPSFNAIVIRNNTINDFYIRGKSMFNDFLVLVGTTPSGEYYCDVLDATADPATTNANRKGTAHITCGSWKSYIRGYHRNHNRPALRQKKDILVYRTKNNGTFTTFDRGDYFACNVHNASGWNKPSAGCVVIKPSQRYLSKIIYSRDENFQLFKKRRAEAVDIPIRTLNVINFGQLLWYVTDINLMQAGTGLHPDVFDKLHSNYNELVEVL